MVNYVFFILFVAKGFCYKPMYKFLLLFSIFVKTYNIITNIFQDRF